MASRADIEVSCFSYDGITAIKNALKAGEACSTEEGQIRVKLVAPPRYVVLSSSFDAVQGIQIVDKAVASIDEAITKAGGTLVVKMKVWLPPACPSGVVFTARWSPGRPSR